MKILLTGKPQIGKSTILQKFSQNYPNEIIGILSHEIRDAQGNRVGFESENMHGKRKVFAQKDPEKGYVVDLAIIDTFIVPELQKGLTQQNALILIDEIGRMQAHSPLFLQTGETILQSNVCVLGTICFDPEVWSLPYKNNPGMIIVTVTEQNRDELPEILFLIFSQQDMYAQLSSVQQEHVFALTKKYFEQHAFIQLKKLWKNAIPYVLQGKVSNHGDDYLVKGRTRDHQVICKNGELVCDCDLFCGKGTYAGKEGMCSHLQAISLLV